MNITALLAVAALLLLALALGAWVGYRQGTMAARLRLDDEAAQRELAREESHRQSMTALEHRLTGEAALQERITQLQHSLTQLEAQRNSWQGQLNEQVVSMRQTTDALRSETTALSTALRRPQTRGQWGELHLRRTVELAGMSEHCDFSEQAHLDGGAQRPDLLVHLAGGRAVVVDAKVSLEGFLDAVAADDPAEAEAHWRRHARQVRTHVDQLSSKRYWAQLDNAPEFVVMFMPSEGCLGSALEHDGDLLEYAARRQVVLASPVTLIALLRTVAHGWKHERLADEAAAIHRLGRDLHDRLQTFVAHFDKVGKSLDSATGSYNDAVGSLESRVLVSARRFQEYAVTGEELESPRGQTTTSRQLALADDVSAPARPINRTERGA